MNKVDLWESSCFSVSSGVPSPIDHTEMQRERGKCQSSEHVLLPPKYTYLNLLNSLTLLPLSSDVLKDM